MVISPPPDDCRFSRLHLCPQLPTKRNWCHTHHQDIQCTGGHPVPLPEVSRHPIPGCIANYYFWWNSGLELIHTYFISFSPPFCNAGCIMWAVIPWNQPGSPTKPPCQLSNSLYSPWGSWMVSSLFLENLPSLVLTALQCSAPVPGRWLAAGEGIQCLLPGGPH